MLKSPAHSYRVRALRRLVPNARFVVMVRNPYEIFESMMKTYRAFTLHYGLMPGMPNRELREVILTERLRCEEKLQAGLSGLGSDRLAIVRYEDLTADPLGTVEQLYRQFGLPDFEKVRPTLVERDFGARGPTRMAAQPPPQWRERLKHDFGRPSSPSAMAMIRKRRPPPEPGCMFSFWNAPFRLLRIRPNGRALG